MVCVGLSDFSDSMSCWRENILVRHSGAADVWVSFIYFQLYLNNPKAEIEISKNYLEVRLYSIFTIY